MPKFSHVPEDLLKDAVEGSSEGKKNKPGKKAKPVAQKEESSGKRQLGLFKKTRAGVVLSREEVKAIKKGRKRTLIISVPTAPR